MIKLEGNNFANITYKKNLNYHVYHMPSGQKLRKHWHTQIEFIYCISNGFKIITDNTVHLLDTGDIAFIIPGAIHELIAPPTGNRIIYLAEVDSIKKMLDLNMIFGIIPPILNISVNKEASLNQAISLLLNRIIREESNSDIFSESMVYSIFIEILGLMGRKFILNTFDQKKCPDNKKHVNEFLTICNYIDQNCTEEMSLEQVAAIAGFSKFHFSRLFSEFTNITFHKYLVLKRITCAEKFLADTDFSVSEIAMHCGFSTPSAFSRAFRQAKGCSPTEFRQYRLLLPYVN